MKFLLLILTSISAIAAPGLYRVPIFSGYDLLAAHASYTGTTNILSPVTNLSGYFYASNQTGTTHWQVPAQTFYQSGMTNFVVSFTLLSTNGPDMGANGIAGFARILLYTNTPINASISLGSPTNILSPYYDSGDKTLLGVFKNGTNIQTVSITNPISRTVLSNANIAFGVVSFNHQSLGTLGSVWLLNGRVTIIP